MLAEFRHSLRRLRGQSIGWGIGVALYGVMMAALYRSVVEMEGLEQMIRGYPKELMAFFGDVQAMASPAGYMDVYFFSYMTLIIGVFVVSAFASVLVGDEEKGTLDLVLAYPISRTALFWGRFLGLVVAVAFILVLGWLGWVIPAGSSGLDLSWVEMARPFLSLFAQLILFGALTLLLSMILPSARLAAMLSGALLVGNFLLKGLVVLDSGLETVFRFTPLYYYQGGAAINGLDWAWLVGLLAISAALAIVGWACFLRRDIRTAGESGWQWPTLALPFRRSRESKQGA